MNKTILVTGAAKRIGKEIAFTFAAEDWNIIIHCHSSTADAEKLAAKKNTNSEIQASAQNKG
jgi:Dehydrogenases with different specificities (related to short-chain alcohol dehydrogenases)